MRAGMEPVVNTKKNQKSSAVAMVVKQQEELSHHQGDNYRTSTSGFWESLAARIDLIEDALEPYFGQRIPNASTRRMILGGSIFSVLFVINLIVSPPIQEYAHPEGEFLLSIRIGFTQGIVAYYQFFVWPAFIRAGCSSRPRSSPTRRRVVVTPRRPSSSGGTQVKGKPKDLVFPKEASVGRGARVTVTCDAGDGEDIYGNKPEAAPPPTKQDHTIAVVASELVDAEKEQGAEAAASPEEATVYNHLSVSYADLLRLGAVWCVINAVTLTITYFLVGPVLGFGGGAFVIYGAGLWRLYRISTQWDPTDGRRHVIFLSLRILLTGCPLAVAPIVVMPTILKLLTARQVGVGYPFVLSFFEYLTVRWVFSDKACERIGEEELTVYARLWASLFEPSRVGLLVIMVNASGNYRELVEATVVSALLDVVKRNNLQVILFSTCRHHILRILRNGGGDDSDGDMRATTPTSSSPSQDKDNAESMPPPPHLPAMITPPLSRFKRLYLALKPGVDIWCVYMLMLMKLFNFGVLPNAMDEDTGNLLPELNCDWLVIGIVFAGEKVGHALGVGVGWCIAKWAPSLVVHVPGESVGTGKSIAYELLVWLFAIYLVYLGIGGMGSVVKTLAAGDTFGV